MNREGFHRVVIVLAVALCLPTIAFARMGMGINHLPYPAGVAAISGQTPFYYYEDPVTCGGGMGMGMMCHSDKFQQWQASQHARAWTGDFMVAQYYGLARPDGDLDQKVSGIKVGCVGCHSPGAYMTMGDRLMNTAPPKPAGTENAWSMLPGTIKKESDRGVFCDFCHTISAIGTPPVNFNFISVATADIDPKRGPGMMMRGHGHMGIHGSIYSPLHDDPRICGSCHDEVDPFGKMVKGTYTEWLNSLYNPATRCQDCHQRDSMMGGMGRRGCMMGMYSMNFTGGFSPWVEGVASLRINSPASASPGREINFTITVTNDKVGHEFPSGSEEERQLWIHVSAHDEAGNSWHIPVTLNPDYTDTSNQNHTYWVTTNAVVAWPSPNAGNGSAIARDALPEGDRLYHSIFISPAYTGNKITYAQYYADRIYSNRLKPREPRVEAYSWKIPQNAAGTVTIRAVLNYRRMPDSMADYLGIMRRPIVQVNAARAIVDLR
ncbi:MAG TPA: multiheme c-type cytochrome [Nitrospirota bacterium]|nr:multiheme c-type cytochrome [Nitrospirota bacterium]